MADSRLRVRYRKVAALVPYARNARTHSPAQVAQIVGSITQFGWTNPILVDETGGIIAGHGRVLAALQLGMLDVPTIELRALREDGFDLGLTGFSDAELDALLEPEQVADTAPTNARTGAPVTRLGDTWVLGMHRLRCGDSTDPADVAWLMAGAQADLLWTDPPYNVDYEGTAGKIMNDAMTPAQFDAFLGAAFRVAFGVMKPGAPAYVAHADSVGVQFRHHFEAAGFYISACLVWVKSVLVLGRQDYQMRHEPILYGWKPGAAHQWHGGRRQTSVLELDEPKLTQTGPNEFQLNIGEESLVIRGQDLTVQRVVGSIILEDKPSRSDLHPTMKPVPLVQRMVVNSTKRGDTVLDLFGGSGTTLMACENVKRRARLMELDPHFCDTIVARWQAATGLKAMLEVDNSSFESTSAQRTPVPA